VDRSQLNFEQEEKDAVPWQKSQRAVPIVNLPVDLNHLAEGARYVKRAEFARKVPLLSRSECRFVLPLPEQGKRSHRQMQLEVSQPHE
jgi:hypothetical protein